MEDWFGVLLWSPVTLYQGLEARTSAPSSPPPAMAATGWAACLATSPATATPAAARMPRRLTAVPVRPICSPARSVMVTSFPNSIVYRRHYYRTPPSPCRHIGCTQEAEQ